MRPLPITRGISRGSAYHVSLRFQISTRFLSGHRMQDLLSAEFSPQPSHFHEQHHLAPFCSLRRICLSSGQSGHPTGSSRLLRPLSSHRNTLHGALLEIQLSQDPEAPSQDDVLVDILLSAGTVSIHPIHYTEATHIDSVPDKSLVATVELMRFLALLHQ